MNLKRKSIIVITVIFALMLGFILFQWIRYSSVHYISKGVKSAQGVVISLLDGSRSIRLKGEDLKSFLDNWSGMFDPQYEVLCSDGQFTVFFEYPYGVKNTAQEVCFSCSNMSHITDDLVLFDKFSEGGTAIYLTFFTHYPDVFNFDDDFFKHCMYYYLSDGKYVRYVESQLDEFFADVEFNHKEFVESFAERDRMGAYHEANFMSRSLLELLTLKNIADNKDDLSRDTVLYKYSNWIKKFNDQAKLELQGKREMVDGNDIWKDEDKFEVRQCFRLYESLLYNNQMYILVLKSSESLDQLSRFELEAQGLNKDAEHSQNRAGPYYAVRETEAGEVQLIYGSIYGIFGFTNEEGKALGEAAGFHKEYGNAYWLNIQNDSGVKLNTIVE